MRVRVCGFDGWERESLTVLFDCRGRVFGVGNQLLGRGAGCLSIGREPGAAHGGGGGLLSEPRTRAQSLFYRVHVGRPTEALTTIVLFEQAAYVLQDETEHLFLHQHSVLFQSDAGSVASGRSGQTAPLGEPAFSRSSFSFTSADSFVSAKDEVIWITTRPLPAFRVS